VNHTKSASSINQILFYRDLTVLIQCKNLKSKVTINLVKEFRMTLEMNGCEKILGIFVSKQGFSDNCHIFAEKYNNLILVTNPKDIQSYIVSYRLSSNTYIKDYSVQYTSSFNVNISIFYIFIFFLTLLSYTLIRAILLNIFL
jgi:Restriction endonuclease